LPSVTDRQLDPGQHAVDFIQTYLKHTKGEWAGRQFILEPWQREGIIRPIFGDVTWECEDGCPACEGVEGELHTGSSLRRVNTAYVEVARKNGKSEIAAALALKLLLADGEAGAEVYGAAADKDQASIVFNVARDMVDMNPHLRKRVKVYRARVMEVPKTGSVYRVLSSDAFSKHGLNAHGIVFDEIHAQPNRELWDVLTTSTGARRQPLTFGITTAGYDRKTICWELHEYAMKVLRGEVDDPSFFAFVQALPEFCEACRSRECEHVDWKNEANWYKANPGLGVFRNIAEMRKMFTRALESPALQNTFRRLYLSQWTSQDERWLDMSVWDRSAGEVDETALRGQTAFAGLDLASVLDVAAFVGVVPVGETFKVITRFWIPERTVDERSRKDNVPYRYWVERGLVKATPGDVIDYEVIKADLIELQHQFVWKDLGYDRWNATDLVTKLQDARWKCTPIGQGYGNLSAPMKDLMTFVTQGRVHHGNNPVLRWMADNLAVEQDPAGNLKPSKKKSTEKIDGMVALIMALDRAVRGGYKKSVYEKRGMASL
jgi:phage terminase large subunit-like protein